MKNYILCLFSFICIFFICACEIETMPSEPVELDCLIDYEFSERINYCDSIFPEDCFNLYAGFKVLSDNAKDNFKDFCYPLNSEISFSNAAMEKIICTVNTKRVYTSTSRITTPVNAVNCKSYCMENQQAVLELKSDRFNIWIELETVLSSGFADSLEELKDNIQTRYSIASCREKLTASGSSFKCNTFFYFPYEDRYDELIVADTSKISYHENILLNGVGYSNMYSSEKMQIINSPIKEHIYFSPETGLVAVRDSLGVLWTKD